VSSRINKGIATLRADLVTLIKYMESWEGEIDKQHSVEEDTDWEPEKGDIPEVRRWLKRGESRGER